MDVFWIHMRWATGFKDLERLYIELNSFSQVKSNSINQ